MIVSLTPTTKYICKLCASVAATALLKYYNILDDLGTLHFGREIIDISKVKYMISL